MTPRIIADLPSFRPLTARRRRRRPTGRRVPRLLLWAVAIPVAAIALVTAAWALDVRASRGEVLRRVEVAGRPVGGLTPGQVATVVDAVADDYSTAPVRIETSDGPLLASTEELGLTVDRAATVDAVLDEGRTGSVLTRPAAWLLSLVSPREAPVVAAVDRERAAAVLAERDPTGRVPAVEPALATSDGEITVTPGEDGTGLDVGRVTDALVAAVATGDLPIEAAVEPGRLRPRFTVADAERLANRARSLTAAPLAVSAGGVAGTVPVETLRTWMRSQPAPSGLELDVDDARALADLAALLPEAGRKPVDAGFRVEGDRVVVTPGSSGTGCCADAAVGLVFDGLVNRRTTAIDLPLRTLEPDRTTEEAQALGIVEPVASFTTRFQAGQSRVVNIHRIADLVRGVVIEPGATFSVNGHVGRRTRDKGFTEGGVIQNGVFETSVGGGISQFATTLFNAAFFAGLDFEEYQSHSIYISRYPYGREATLSYPKPDLILRNSTDHGVLLWPTYDASSITVTMWSTRHITADQTGQRKSQAGRCTRVTTERTRTYPDGTRKVDHVYATYRPGEGVNC